MNTIELRDDEKNSSRYIIPTVRAVRLVSYLQSLKQDYELPEMSFTETIDIAEEVVLATATDEKDDLTSDSSLPDWLGIK